MDSPLGESLLTASQSWDAFLSTTSNTATATASISDLSIPAHTTSSASWLALVGQALFVMVRALPGLLIWIITFTTMTLPTLLFALFSTSLTFTMNFTTLYFKSRNVQPSVANTDQDVDYSSLRFNGLMDRQISLPQHVRTFTSRAPTERTPDRSLPRYPRWRLKTRTSQLPR